MQLEIWDSCVISFICYRPTTLICNLLAPFNLCVVFVSLQQFFFYHHHISFNSSLSYKQCLRLLVYMNNCSEYTKNRHRNCVCVQRWWWICGRVLSDGWTQSRVTHSFPMAVIFDRNTTGVTKLTKPLKMQWKWWSAIVYVQMPSVEDIIRPWDNKM